MADSIVMPARELSKTQSWIIKARVKHGNRYCYDRARYTDANSKITVTCRVHGDYEVSAASHLSGCHCKQCSKVSRPRRRIANKFKNWLKDCTEFHNGIYNYDRVIYRGCKVHVEIVCPVHGVFTQSPDAHRRGGCHKCADIVRNETVNRHRIETARNEFFAQSPIVHDGKYDYSKADYKTSEVKVEIVCPDHGSFWQWPRKHVKGQGCSKCARNNSDHAAETFIEVSTDVHHGKYDYSRVEYTHCESNVDIVCPVHGVFDQSPIAHKRGQGCPHCKDSHGEREIAKYLDAMGVSYERQKRFKTCRDKRKLSFDFFIPATNLFTKDILIEYDGRQHFEAVEFFGGEENLAITQRRDAIKTKWAEDHGYDLIRIPYSDYGNIKAILGKLRV